MTICQYYAPDRQALQRIIALAELTGCDYRITGPVVVVRASDGIVELLQRGSPSPSAIVRE